MSITMNLYYTGKNGNARKFAEEMENSGTADAVRREDGNLISFLWLIPKRFFLSTAGRISRHWIYIMLQK